MLSLLLGSDDFSKKQYIQELAAKNKADVVFFGADEHPLPEELIQADLFSKPKVYELKGLIGKYNTQDIIEKLIASKNHIIIIELKLDKRLTENKQLLANKNIVTKQFDLPHGKELNSWIINRVIQLGGIMEVSAVEALAVALGRDDAKEVKAGGKVVSSEEIYSLWQAESEIQKLMALCQGREISAADVVAVSSVNGEVDVFDLTNAIADNEKHKALELLHKFLIPQSGSDEKGAVIQLNALLSEQFRNVAIVQDFSVRKTSEAEILESTGWKSGRLFIMKKIASRFPAKKVLEFLTKLTALDEELKTGSTPPKVLLDLIVAQLLV